MLKNYGNFYSETLETSIFQQKYKKHTSESDSAGSNWTENVLFQILIYKNRWIIDDFDFKITIIIIIITSLYDRWEGRRIAHHSQNENSAIYMRAKL